MKEKNYLLEMWYFDRYDKIPKTHYLKRYFDTEGDMFRWWQCYKKHIAYDINILHTEVHKYYEYKTYHTIYVQDKTKTGGALCPVA